ncbi:hypothetical protein C0J52_21839 [Blattella germanica]|nr:hypothetical protein C0J52_21839 [Blattella germanica]
MMLLFVCIIHFTNTKHANTELYATVLMQMEKHKQYFSDYKYKTLNTPSESTLKTAL